MPLISISSDKVTAGRTGKKEAVIQSLYKHSRNKGFCKLLRVLKRVIIFVQSLQSRLTLQPHGLQHARLLCPLISLSLLKFMSIESVQSLSCIWLFATPLTAAHQASQSITNSWSLLKLMSIEWVMPSNHFILCHPLLLSSILTSIRVFFNESVLCIRWQKYWSFSFNICPSNECSGLISFRIHWFDLLAVQGTLKSLLQNHSSKASIPWHSASFMVQLSHSYMTTEKPYLWLDGSLSAKYCLFLLIRYLGLSQLSFQGTSIF